MPRGIYLRSAEYIKNISGNNNHFYGKHHNDKTKLILSKKSTGKKLSNITKEKLSKSQTERMKNKKNLDAVKQPRKIPTKPLKIDKNLFYILGVLKGDGSVDYKKYSISLDVKDKDFAIFFKNILEEWSGMKVSLNVYSKEYMQQHWKYPDMNSRYSVSLSSKYVVNFLKNINYQRVKVMNKRCKSLFLRGMYDSEGCVSYSIKYYKKYGVIINREINLSNNDKNLLLFCKDLLNDLGIKSNSIVTNGNCFGFEISRKDNLIKFAKIIGISIKRKSIKLQECINSYEQRREKP